MEDLLPLLFLIIAMGISAVKSFKKKEQTRQEAESTFPPRPATVVTRQESRQTFPSASTVSRVKPEVSREENIHGKKVKRPSSRFAKTDSQTQLTDRTLQADESAYSLDTAEEARRAIIYSEIMNRKY